MLSPAAASLTSSVIGGLMIAGSAGVKIPQISRIVRSQSVYGLAPTAFYAESAVYSAQCAYHLRSGFPFATWGENLALLLQNTVCIVLLRRFGEGGMTVGRAAADAAFFVLLLLALAACEDAVSTGSSTAGDVGLLADVSQVGSADVWQPLEDIQGPEKEDAAPEPTGGLFGAPCSDNTECFSGFCVEGPEGYLCTKICETECPIGYDCKAVGSDTDATFLCLPEVQKVCTPCAVDYECGAGACLVIDGEGRCSYSCETEDDCPGEGYKCEAQGDANPDERWCLPASNSCWCTADSAGTPRTCTDANEYGTCYGIETCDPELGWVGCNAKTPAEEICNGLDDDCDGVTDESFADFGAACDSPDDSDFCMTGYKACVQGTVKCFNDIACVSGGACIDPGFPATHYCACQGLPCNANAGDQCTEQGCKCNGGAPCTGFKKCKPGVGCE